MIYSNALFSFAGIVAARPCIARCLCDELQVRCQMVQQKSFKHRTHEQKTRNASAGKKIKSSLTPFVSSEHGQRFRTYSGLPKAWLGTVYASDAPESAKLRCCIIALTNNYYS